MVRSGYRVCGVPSYPTPASFELGFLIHRVSRRPGHWVGWVLAKLGRWVTAGSPLGVWCPVKVLALVAEETDRADLFCRWDGLTQPNRPDYGALGRLYSRYQDLSPPMFIWVSWVSNFSKTFLEMKE